MAIRTEYALREALTNMRRNLFVTLAAVLVAAVSLFLLGGVFLLRTAVSRSTTLLTRQVEVAVFLTSDVSDEERQKIQADLQAIPEIAHVIYESKKDAYERFKKLFVDQPDIVANTSADALPESFRVKLKDPSQFAIIRDRLGGRPGIQQIQDERETVKQVFFIANTVRQLALIIALLVGFAALVLIATTIRMAIYARRKEIGIMKLVGATNWFIRIPFIIEGVVQGVTGALFAAIVLFGVRPFITHVLGAGYSLTLGLRVTYADTLVQGLFLLVAGAVGGAVGSVFGLRRFLDV